MYLRLHAIRIYNTEYQCHFHRLFQVFIKMCLVFINAEVANDYSTCLQIKPIIKYYTNYFKKDSLCWLDS